MPTNDPYGLLASGLPPEIASQAQGLSRRDAILKALMQRSLQSIEPPEAKGRFQGAIPAAAIFAPLVEAMMSKRGLEKNQQDWGALREKYNTGQSEAADQYSALRSGLPEIPQPSPELGGGPGRPQIPGDPRAAIEYGSKNPYFSGSPLLKADLAAWEKSNQPFDLAAGATRYEPSGKVVVSAPQKISPMYKDVSIGEDMFQPKVSTDGGKSWEDVPGSAPYKKMQAGANAPLEAVVKDGKPVLVPRSQAAGMTPVKSDVGVQAGLASGVAEAKSEQKRQFSMQGIGATIKEAEDLLTGASGKDKPTGSGVGTAVDWAAGLVGKTPSGAKEAQTLKAIGGAMTAKMPRMEGPQSDKDTLLYKEMAANVGDSTLPRDRRLAALEKVKELWSKYERLNPEAFTDRRSGSEPPPGAVRLKK